jgi:MFS family permease
MHNIKDFFLPSYQSNIPKFMLYRALANFMLSLPVWVIFLQNKHGLTLTQITLIDVAFWMVMVFAEVPTGAFADTLGRKQSLLIGVILIAISNFAFALAPTFTLVLVANGIWAIALTFISGANMAFFYDSLRELGREADFPKYRGQLQAVALTSIAVSGAFGGVIGEWNMLATFLISGGLMVIAAGIVLTFKEPPREPDPESGGTLSYGQTLKVAFGAIRENAGLRFVLLYSALLPVVIAPIRLTFMQPYAIAIGLPIVALGFISVGIRGFQILGSLRAQKTVKKLGEQTWLRLAPVLVLGGILAIGVFNNLIGIGIFALTAFASAATRPLVETLILRQTPGSVRATILSVDSLISRLLLSGIEISMGLLADSQGLPGMFMWMGVAFGVLMTILLVLWGRKPEKVPTADAV